MGYRLNVAKTYKVEFGMDGFNRQVDAVHKLLKDNCKECFFTEDETHIDVDKEEFLELAVSVNRMSEDEFKVYGFDDYYTRAVVHDILLRMYLDADKEEENIHLFWFGLL